MLAVAVGWTACAGDSNTEDLARPRDALTRLERQLARTLESNRLRTSEAERKLVPNPCIGIEDKSGTNLRYYFAEPDRSQGRAMVRRIERTWRRQRNVVIVKPATGQNFVTVLAQVDDLLLEAYWFPGSKQLAIGGSTPC